MIDNNKTQFSNKDEDTKVPDESETSHETAGIQTEDQPEDKTNEAEDSENTFQTEESLVEKADKEAKQAYDKYLRLSAEFDNYKKRMIRETDEFKKYANESLISALLPAIDNLERAIKSAIDDTNNSESLIQGVELTLNDILQIFAKYQVEPIESVGKPFDPNFHQAMLQEETDDYPDNTIIQELQKGYTIHNRLLRPAMVVVSKAKNK